MTRHLKLEARGQARFQAWTFLFKYSSIVKRIYLRSHGNWSAGLLLIKVLEDYASSPVFILNDSYILVNNVIL